MNPDPASYPLQPPDETPLPHMAIPATAPAQAQAIPGLASQLGAGRDEVISALADHAGAINTALQDNINNVNIEAMAHAANASQQIDKAAKPVYNAVTKTIKDTNKALEVPYVDMYHNGVNTPLTLNDMVNDLESPGYSAITGRFAPQGTGQGISPSSTSTVPTPKPPQSIVPDSYPYMCKPRPGFPAGGPTLFIPSDFKGDPETLCPIVPVDQPSGRMINDTFVIPQPPPPPQPPPIPPPPIGTPEQHCGPNYLPGDISPDPAGLATGQVLCAPGYYPVELYPGCWACRPGQQQPPPPPPPPPPQCGTVQSTCTRVNIGKFWVSVKCIDECNADVCVYVGNKPPDNPNGKIVAGPLDIAPSTIDLNRYATTCLQQQPTSPLVGPPPPPVGPPPPPQPPPPPIGGKPQGIEPVEGSISGVDWSQPTACSAAEQIVEEEISIPAGGISVGPLNTDTIVSIVGGSIASALGGPLGYVANQLVSLTGSDRSSALGASGLPSLGVGIGLARDFIDRLTGGSIPNKSAAIGLGSEIALANTAERITGLPLTYLAQSVQYTYQYANPQFLPTQPDTDALYLTNKITSGLWECYTRAQGNIPSVWSMVLDSKQTKPIASDVVSLFRRGIIPDQASYYERMRELGVLNTQYSDEIYKLSEQLPGVSDQIRFMVRDVWDESVVKQYNYDKDYEQKFAGKAKQLALATGVSEDWFRYYWRAHWEIPSNTALYEMLHRLRPDRPDVIDTVGHVPNDAELAELRSNPLSPAIVTTADVQRAIEVNDMSPGWINPLIAISYRPITNSDAARAFEIGTFNETDLYHAFRDNGYNDTDAKRQVVFYSGQRSRKVANASGVWTTRKTIKAYKDGMIDRQQADDLLRPILIADDVRKRALDGADIEADVEAKRSILKQFHQRYLYGEIEDAALHDLLQSQGIQPSAVSRIEEQWFNERQGRAKEPRVQMLCQWFTRGFIDQTEYFTRLQRLGYSNDDAGRIAKVCAYDYAAKKAKAAAVASAKAAKELQAQQRQEKADITKQISNLQKELKDYQKQIADAKKELEKQQKQQQSQSGSTQ